MKRLLASLQLAAMPALAQCVMCFRTAEAQNHARMQVLNVGVLLLGAPPFLILAGYCYLFYRKNQVTRNGEEIEVQTPPGAGRE
jgi:hypothetical protein